MNNKMVGLIGLGVIGAPIAEKLYGYYGDNFYLIASGERKERLLKNKIQINNRSFKPNIICSKDEIVGDLDLLVVCVKNYHLDSALEDIKKVIGKNTKILPLQNGIYSYKLFCNQFPENIVLRGYVQGPNTVIRGLNITYTNPGIMHIGKTQKELKEESFQMYDLLLNAGIDVVWEDNIKKMAWKKWMLNVAGNSITALTLADYSYFKNNDDIQVLCRQAMHEFLLVAQYENVNLLRDDIDDVINYYCNYQGNKKTSMLEDILNNRMTENEFLAGYVLRLAEKHNLSVPMIKTLYLLIKIRQDQYIKF
jgi:2-dehydropantoate 2-reductase